MNSLPHVTCDAFHTQTCLECAPWLPAIPLMLLGMHQGKANPELGPKELPPSKTKMTAGRSVEMVQSKKSVFC